MSEDKALKQNFLTIETRSRTFGSLPWTSPRGRHGTAGVQWSFRGMQWIPFHFHPLYGFPHQQIPVHAWHALHTWIVRSSGRSYSVILGFVREPMPTTCSDLAEQVPRARPVRFSLEKRWGWGTAPRRAIKANLLNTQPLWVALIAFVYLLFFC